MSDFDIEVFLKMHKDAAFKLDLEEFQTVASVLKKQERLLKRKTNPDYFGVKEFCIKALAEIENRILLLADNGNIDLKRSEILNVYLLNVRIYYEYKMLYDNVTDALEPQKEKKQVAKTNDKKITEIEKFELLFTKAGYDTEGLRNFFIGCNLGNKNLAILIYHIKKQANLPMSFYLKNFMQWINKEAHYTGVNDYLGKQKKIEFPDAYTDEELQELLDQIEEYKNF